MSQKRPMKLAGLITALILLIPAALSPAFAAPFPHEDYRDIYGMVSDPDTSRFANYFAPSTIENGHIWVDKTVNTDSVTFYDHEGWPIHTINSKPEDFLVTLSALSQSYSIETIVEPSDTVFILDVSASMYVYQLGGVSRAAVMVEALNDAIHTIMNANPHNRVAVVAYGGYASGAVNMSRSQQILKLGHYSVTGNLLSISANRITVSSLVPSDMVAASSVAVDGATPTQRGIYEGAKVLEENDDTQYRFTTEKGQDITITRRPVMVLLTDGDPTFGWTNHEMHGSDSDYGYNHGDGNPASTDMGTDLLSVLTASYWKQRVREHYYGTDDRDTQFYTIGVGVSGVHAPAVMDPAKNAGANSQAFAGMTYNMRALLDQFVDPADGRISFPALDKGSSTARSLVTVENANHYLKSYAYTDGYYSADNRQALGDAFQSIAYNIISMGSYTTEANPSNPDFSGYVVVADPIGKYMRFKESKGSWVHGEMYYGMMLAKSITAEPEGGELWNYWSGMLAARMGIGKSTAAELIATNIAAGAMYYKNDDDFRATLLWYADNATNFVGLYYDRGGNTLPPPAGSTGIVELHPMYNEVYNGVTGEATSLLYMYLEVVTALQAGDFSLGPYAHGMYMPLAENQQMVGWFIPASLMPLRTVSEVFYEGNPDRVDRLEISEAFPIRTNYTVGLADGFEPSYLTQDYKALNAAPNGYYFYSDDWPAGDGDNGAQTVAVFEPNKYNPYYYFTEDTPVYAADGTGYVPAESYAPGADYYSLKKYFDRNVPGYIAAQYEPVNQQVTQILTGPDGKPYIPAGEHREIRTVTVAKDGNPTGTSDVLLDADFDGSVQFYWLGNNGRLTISGLSDIAAEKLWQGTPLSSVWVQLYADGRPYRDPAELSQGGRWKHTWTDLLTYGTAADADDQVAFIQYSVAEGSYQDGVFTPYSEQNPLDGYTVSYSQPGWDDSEAGLTDAVILNTQEGYAPPVEGEEEYGPPKEPPVPEEPPAAPEEPPVPETGDVSGLFLWSFTLFVSGTALVILKRYGRPK